MDGRPLRGRDRPGYDDTIWIEDREVIELAILSREFGRWISMTVETLDQQGDRKRSGRARGLASSL